MSEFCWDHHNGYKLTKVYVDLCTRHCFSRFKVEGLENIPTDAAVLFAPNHCCTLMDALVMLRAYRDPSAFGARADIFRKPRIARILRWLRIVPLARERDGMQALSGNWAIFNEVVDCIGNGMPFCMFCEGTHHPGRLVHPLKGGILRICDLAMENLPAEKEIYIVPVGLDYDDLFRLMRGITVRFGEPVRVRDLKDRDHREVLNDLQCRIQQLISCNAPVVERKPLSLRLPLAVASLPIFIACAVGASPILIATLFVKNKLKDMAWINTVRFACSLFFFVLWPFHSGFYALLNFYSEIINDLKK